MKNFTNESASYQEAQAQPVTDTASVLKSINRMAVFVAIIVGAAMFADQRSATTAVLAGAAFYLIVAGLLILFQPTALPWIIVNGQNQKTIRLSNVQEHKVHMTLAQSQVSLVPPVQLPRMGSARPLALPQVPNYVSAVPPADERLKLACYQFVRALFDEDGKPLPKRILPEHTKSPGLVQHEKPKPDAVEYLTGLQMVWMNERKQLFFNVEHYPTLRYCINAIKLGTPAGRVDTPPSNSPHPSPQLHEYERDSHER